MRPVSGPIRTVDANTTVVAQTYDEAKVMAEKHFRSYFADNNFAITDSVAESMLLVDGTIIGWTVNFRAGIA